MNSNRFFFFKHFKKNANIFKTEKNFGFTLIELLIVIAILSILAVISFSVVVSLQPSFHLKAATRDLISDIRYAQQLAVTQQVDYGVLFSSSTNSYQIIKHPTTSTSAVIKQKDLPGDIFFKEISGFTNDEVVYNPYGAVKESGTIILVNQNNQTKTIAIKPSGFVKEE